MSNRIIGAGLALDALREARPDERRPLLKKGLLIAASSEMWARFPVRILSGFRFELAEAAARRTLLLEWTLTPFGQKVIGPIFDEFAGKNLSSPQVWCQGFIEQLSRTMLAVPGVNTLSKFSAKDFAGANMEGGISMYLVLVARTWPYMVVSPSIRLEYCKAAYMFYALGIDNITVTRKGNTVTALLR